MARASASAGHPARGGAWLRVVARGAAGRRHTARESHAPPSRERKEVGVEVGVVVLEPMPMPRRKCYEHEKLTQVLEAERDSQKTFQPLPFHYVEISRLLFDQ
ncbi:hypothetical protein HYC85_013784 [Camellia sinensis]|uniref:Uncharacterized protein n=1 Tax=Camellia sinensis TaxID=4442 RepID=A0A7J7H5I3_CAMSI|nr:hypothetical protein HYC85_013784 [Camellia sinensis]